MTKKISICMIVKDEEKNLRRCLDSLKPLLERENTELIIVDTGSTDGTVDIAKKYTQKIYFHEWNGNFSDMRNISISYAIGEWIFIIDADEELETAFELITLIESSQINQFNTIRIREKNLLSIKSNKYVYHVQERLFKNDGTFQYKGTIHNQPVYQHPVFTADNIWLMHYGYINEDKDLMEKKFKRTATMLKKELSINPENVYYRFQLARSYLMHGDTLLAWKEIKKAYKSMKKQLNEIKVHRFYVYGEYARIGFLNSEYNQVIDICKEGLLYNEYNLDLHYYLGHAYCALEEYEIGLSTLKKYIELYSGYYRNELDLSNYAAVEMYTLDKESFEVTLDRLISIVYKNRDIKRDLNQYKPILNDIENKVFKAKLLTKVFILEGKFNKLLDLYKDMEVGSRYSYINYLETLKKDFNNEQIEKVEQIFSELQDDYGLINRIRLEENNKKLLLEFINSYEITNFSDEIIVEFAKYLIDSKYLNRFFKKIDSLTIKKIVKVLIDKEDKMDYFLNSLRNDFKFNDFQNNRVFIAIANVLILSEIEEKNEKNILDIFYKYIEKGLEYIQYIYNRDRIRLFYKTHENLEERFLMIMYLYSVHRNLGEKNIAIKYIKEAGETYPYLSKLISLFAREMKAELQVSEIITSFNEVKNNEQNIKVLHGTIEIAGQMNTLVKGLNQISNVTAVGLNNYPSFLSYQNENILDISIVENKKEILEASLDTFDIFHFHFNTSIIPNLEDLPLLKENNKKIFMHNWGSDVRLLSRAKQLSPYAKAKNEDEASIIRNLQYLAKYIDDCIVADAELYEYVKGFYNRVHFVRQALDLSQYRPDPTFEFRKTKPVIVHAPTSSHFKGTDTVNAVIEQLKLKYDLEYKLVQNLSHEEAKEVYRSADIIIDQLHGNGHGLFSLEGMALGKPVITSISEFMADYYPKDIPIVSANPNNLEKKVEQLIKDYEMRIDLGNRGRIYVEKYHDHSKIANDLLKIYNS